MKKTTKFLFSLILVASTCLVMNSCGGDDPVDVITPVDNPSTPNNNDDGDADLNALERMLLGTWKYNRDASSYTVITFNSNGTSDWIEVTDGDKDKFSLAYQLSKEYLSFQDKNGETFHFSYVLSSTKLTFDNDEYVKIDNYVDEDDSNNDTDTTQDSDTEYPNRGAVANKLRGSGTPSDPYIISDATELRKLADDVESGKTYRDEYFKMTADVIINRNVLSSNGSLNGTGSNFEQWKPIGKSKTPFCGMFDGNGHTISGIYINKEQRDSLGLFGFFSGTVKNLTIKDSYVTGRQYVGTLIGFASASKYSTTYNPSISYCVNYGKVGDLDHSNTKYSYRGGVIGYIEDGFITKCVNYGAIEAYYRVGGITGYVNSSNISDCTNYGAVTAISTLAAGICGYIGPTTNSKSLSNCVNFGIIKGSSCSGIACSCHVKLLNVVNYGQIIDTNSNKTYAISNVFRGSSSTKVIGKNLYFLETSANEGVFYKTSYATVTNCKNMTSNQMKDQSFLNELNTNVNALGSGYSKWKFGEDGFPVLE